MLTRGTGISPVSKGIINLGNVANNRMPAVIYTGAIVSYQKCTQKINKNRDPTIMTQHKTFITPTKAANDERFHYIIVDMLHLVK